MRNNNNCCQPARPKWCTWLTLLVAAILALLLLRGCLAHQTEEVTTSTVVTTPAAVVTPPAAAPAVAPAPVAVESNMAKDAQCVDTLKTTIEFATGRSALTDAGQGIVDKVAACLKEGHFEVAGHTDSQGSAASNQTLSEARAASVVAYLTSKGIAADRMTAKGYGDTVPIASNDTAEGRQQNRRITFVAVADTAASGS